MPLTQKQAAKYRELSTVALTAGHTLSGMSAAIQEIEAQKQDTERGIHRLEQSHSARFVDTQQELKRLRNVASELATEVAGLRAERDRFVARYVPLIEFVERIKPRHSGQLVMG